MQRAKKQVKNLKIPKSLTGISGLDVLTGGGLPVNRTTLIVGGPGSGKTIIAMEYLIKGAIEYKEPGIFITFEENSDELNLNLASMGYDINALIAEKKIYLEHVEIEHSETIETGAFNLEGLFVRLEYAINRIGAKRIVLDSLDALFNGTKYEQLRWELKRLFMWFNYKIIY